MRPIGPKVQTQVPPETYKHIKDRMEAERRTEAEVVRELIEAGVIASRYIQAGV